MTTPRIVITAAGAVCSGGKTPGDILAGVRAGTSTIAPIQQWDTTGWPTTMAGEIANFNAREMVDDRKLHKLIRRTDLLGPLCRGQGDRRRRRGRAPRHAGARCRSGVQRPHRRLRRIGQRQLREPVRLLSAAGCREGQPARVRARTGQHGQSDVAAAFTAQQRAGPHRHQVRPQGQQRVHHQPQLQRLARGDRRHGSAAQRRSGPRRRGRATTRRSSHRWCCTTIGSG